MSRLPDNLFPTLTLISGLLMTGVSTLVAPTRADHPGSALFQTAGYVRDDFGQPVTNILVYGDNFIGDVYPSTTDSNGLYVVTYPADGNYRLTVDCAQLIARGYGCVGDVGIAQEADLILVDFLVPRLNASLQITNSSLPRGHVGLPYMTQLGAAGGQPPYYWRLATNSPTLPPGLSLDSSGLLSGVPDLYSAANLSVTVTDAAADTTAKNLLLVINPKPVLSMISWVSNRVTMRVLGAPHQDYTLQVATNLDSAIWTSLFITNNPDIGTFIVRDPTATNAIRMYRILIER